VLRVVSRVPHLLGWLVAALLFSTSTRANEDYNPWRTFGIDEVRLGALIANLEGRHGGIGYSFTPEKDADVNVEVVFISPLPQASDAVLDFLLRPRPILGATINTQGQTSQIYLGAAWSLPLFNVLFLEGTLGGSYHDGPLNSQAPNYRSSDGCRVNFHESAALGVELGGNWRIMATVEHMSNAGLCEPNAGLSSWGARLGYKFNP
jgi:lipid A 3-O-deacylase